MKDQETQLRFVQLRAQGWSFARIARELGVATGTLVKWSRKFQFDIQNSRAVEDPGGGRGLNRRGGSPGAPPPAPDLDAVAIGALPNGNSPKGPRGAPRLEQRAEAARRLCMEPL